MNTQHTTFDYEVKAAVRVEVKAEYRAGRATIIVYVNGTELTQRQSEEYARTKAHAFASRLAADGHSVVIIDYTLPVALARKTA